MAYNACYGPPRHYVKHYRHHANRYHRHHYARARSSASITVYNFWDVYPNYSCGSCTRCVEPRCSVRHYDEDYSDYRTVHYRDSEYHSSYYSASSDMDYDTSTADDVGGRGW
jgi:hypothetical protein